MACIDWAAGVLLAELKKLGLDKNTLIIFTSDNGSRNDTGFSNGPLRGRKFTTWEGGMRVPPPREAFFYYRQNNLEAVRAGKWKLHFRKDKEEVKELYDLDADSCESRNVYEEHPEVVRLLEDIAEQCRADLGDDATGREGRNCRPIGKVDNPVTLTHYDENHPSIMAMYDIKDAG